MSFTQFLNDGYIGDAEFITEAMDLSKKNKNGHSREDFLKALYDEFGENAWVSRGAYSTLKKGFGKAPAPAHLQSGLIKAGMMEKTSSGDYQLTANGIALAKTLGGSTTAPTPEPDAGDLAKGVKDITKLKVKKFKVPKPGKNSKFLATTEQILQHMVAQSRGMAKTSMLLAGDPGSGKTSFINSIAKLTGIPLVIIEAPHITQEHLVNIPFIVVDGVKKKQGNLVVDDIEDEAQTRVVQAESNLVTTLRNKRKKTPEAIQRLINKDKVLRDLQPEVQYLLDILKGKYNTILFLDEYYRASSMKIRNVLRNILNGKIGNDKIPKGVYIVMATNIGDEGTEDVPQNQAGFIIDYEVSSKEDFMNYMYGKYVNNPEDNLSGIDIDDNYDDTNDYEEYEEEDVETPKDLTNVEITKEVQTHIEVKQEVWNAFMDGIEDSDLGANDEASEVRFSPRRLEQLILYVDAALPVANLDEARELMSFLKNNFTNYLNKKTFTSLKDAIEGQVKDLIVELSPELATREELDKLIPLPDTEWKMQLAHELDMKMKLGEERKYVPVVSGLPGIGKTTVFEDIAKDKDMGFIQYDISNVNAEDAIGMPVADTSRGNDNITVSFSMPNMYQVIMRQYLEQIEDCRVEGRKYNIILLFDELNRTSTPVFNAIRQVLLEKSFGEDKDGKEIKLPSDIMVVGAINPTDNGSDSVIEFTSHVRDVLDIIPAAQSSVKLFDYNLHKEKFLALNDGLGFNLTEAVCNCMSSLANEFKSTVDDQGEPVDYDEQPFWWDISGNVVYVSGREMTESIGLAINDIELAFRKMKWDPTNSYTDKQFNNFIKTALAIVARDFNTTFKMVSLKADVGRFTKEMGLKIENNDKYSSFFVGIKSPKAKGAKSLPDLLVDYGGDIQGLDKSVMGKYVGEWGTQPSTFTVEFAEICKEWQSKEGITLGVMQKIMELTLRLSKSFKTNKNIKNDYNNNLVYQSKLILKDIISNPLFDLASMIEDDAIMKKLDKYNKQLEG